MRIGMGYDVHRLVYGRKLILGGIDIPFHKGLIGHSDADVLVHAICDAVLGAAGLGDIGINFPDHDLKYKDMYSIKLLEISYQMIKDKELNIVNLDSTVFAEAPKLSPYNETMTVNIAETLNLDKRYVNIKATTTEGLGFIGKGDGIGAMCIALLR